MHESAPAPKVNVHVKDGDVLYLGDEKLDVILKKSGVLTSILL